MPHILQFRHSDKFEDEYSNFCDNPCRGFDYYQARRQLNWNGGGGMDSQYKLLSELLSDQAAFITSPKTSLANYWGALPPTPPPPSVYGPDYYSSMNATVLRVGCGTADPLSAGRRPISSRQFFRKKTIVLWTVETALQILRFQGVCFV